MAEQRGLDLERPDGRAGSRDGVLVPTGEPERPARVTHGAIAGQVSLALQARGLLVAEVPGEQRRRSADQRQLALVARLELLAARKDDELVPGERRAGGGAADLAGAFTEHEPRLGLRVPVRTTTPKAASHRAVA